MGNGSVRKSFVTGGLQETHPLCTFPRCFSSAALLQYSARFPANIPFRKHGFRPGKQSVRRFASTMPLSHMDLTGFALRS